MLATSPFSRGAAPRPHGSHLRSCTIVGILSIRDSNGRWLSVGLALAITSSLMAATSQLRGAPFGQDRQTRQEATEAIPFNKLSENAQAKLWNVVSKPSLYRQLPVSVIEADPDMYLMLVRYPEVIVNMWQLMGVTKVDVDRTGGYRFDASDGAGTVCKVELIYGDQNTHVFYAEGTYEGVLLKNLIRGRCVMVLQSEYTSTQDQKVYVTSQLDLFVQFDNAGAEILAKTLHPLIGKSADHNFTESTKFLGQVSSAAERQTMGLQRLTARLTNIDAEVRDKFLEVSATASHRRALRDAGHAVWEADAQSIAIDSAPLVMANTSVEGATRQTIPDRKPLNLRR